MGEDFRTSIDTNQGRDLGAFEELEMADLEVEMAAEDERDTMWDPNSAPKAPHPREEATTDRTGGREVDTMEDTEPIEDVVSFDLDDEDLSAVDIDF